MVCKLEWARSFNLNNRCFRAGYGFREFQIGPFLEGQEFSTNLVAKYESSSYNPFVFGVPPCRSTIRYELPLTQFQKDSGLNFNPQTGVLSGRILDVDQYLAQSSSNEPINPEAYYDFVKLPNPRRLNFYGKAYLANDPSEFVEGNFYLDMAVSWDSKRRALMIGPRKIQSDFFIDGKKASNELYFSYLRSNRFI